jgi:hypothetical protein
MCDKSCENANSFYFTCQTILSDMVVDDCQKYSDKLRRTFWFCDRCKEVQSNEFFGLLHILVIL